MPFISKRATLARFPPDWARNLATINPNHAQKWDVAMTFVRTLEKGEGAINTKNRINKK